MKRLAKYDVGRRFTRPSTRIAAQVGFGLACTLAMIAVRTAVDMVAPTAGPFAMVYLVVMLATLYGHWQAGVVASVTSFLWAWYFILPEAGSFEFRTGHDASRVTINAVTALVVLVFAEAFRRAVVAAVQERDTEIERGAMLLAELDHRTKNNFALVASLLELQKRRSENAEVKEALEKGIARIHSFAAAYSNLAQSQGEGAIVAMRPYLKDVVAHFTRAGFHDGVEVELDADACEIPREVAVAIGLFANEALTNCAKYAFPDGRSGKVEVRFHCSRPEEWSLEICDNGVGYAQEPTSVSGSGLGATLLQAFAQQAQAKYEFRPSDTGCQLLLARAG